MLSEKKWWVKYPPRHSLNGQKLWLLDLGLGPPFG
jgi:hypothetical protein